MNKLFFKKIYKYKQGKFKKKLTPIFTLFTCEMGETHPLRVNEASLNCHSILSYFIISKSFICYLFNIYIPLFVLYSQ